ncbi:MAG: hypothetical protein HY907_02695 [Deltaproteobacteria bacterium]|nr:hypothetical protein [Deltaproteobacteria bacterium]
MRWAATAFLVLLGGCNLGNPGDLVGEMTVSATVSENSCGSAVGQLPGTTTIDVQLYERDGVLTWVGSQGTFQADIDEEGNFVAHSTGSQMLRAEEPDGYGGVLAPCVIDATEEIRGTLVRRVTPESSDGGEGDAATESAPDDAGEAADGGDADGGEPEEAVPASVVATDTLQVSVSAGANCSDFIGAGAGAFQTLPCRVVVELEGSE